jgi:hypothetical protein
MSEKEKEPEKTSSSIHQIIHHTNVSYILTIVPFVLFKQGPPGIAGQMQKLLLSEQPV